MNTYNSLKSDLLKLGVSGGDTIFLRVSYKAMGKAEGGPKTLIDAIMDIIGGDGTIILTAFPIRYINKIKWFYKNKIFDNYHRPKSNTGALSYIAMTYPNALVSKRIDFPFVVIGKNAQYLTSNHTYDKSGYWLLEEAIIKYNCKCLRIGGEPYIGTTHMSLSHILKERGEYQMAPRYGLYVKEGRGLKWYENENVIFCPNAFKGYLAKIIDKIKLGEGNVGNGNAVITDMKISMQLEEALFREDLKRILCDNPECWICQSSFSFSESSRFVFFFRKLISILSSNVSSKRSLIRELIENTVLATKNQ